MSKKVIGALLAIVMVLSVFSFTVFADSTGYDTNPKHKQTWGLANKTGSNGTYTVDVLLSTNYPVGPLQFKLEGVDKVTKVTVGNGYYAAEAYANATGLISIIPDGSSDVAVRELTKAVVATVTYTSGENDTPSIKEDVKSASNPQGTLMASFADGNGYLSGSTFLTGQAAKVYDLGEEWTEETVEPADLALKSGVSGVVIDTAKTFGGAYAGAVYGVTATTYKSAANITNSVEATNGGSLTVKPAGDKAGCFGTGTTIEVLNADGSSTGKTYVFVVFGDVDCNGLINGNDAQAVLDVVAGNTTIAPNNSVMRLAGNCQNVSTSATMMHNLNGNDAQAILDHVAGTKLNQSTLAETHNKFNNFYK